MAKHQCPGSPRATGCLDFSQGIFGKCHSRNLLTKLAVFPYGHGLVTRLKHSYFSSAERQCLFFQVRMCVHLEMSIISQHLKKRNRQNQNIWRNLPLLPLIFRQDTFKPICFLTSSGSISKAQDFLLEKGTLDPDPAFGVFGMLKRGGYQVAVPQAV